MQIIRYGSHTKRQAARYGSWVVGLALLTFVIFSLTRYTNHLPGIGLVLALLSLVTFVALRDVAAPLFERWSTGAIGEWKVLRYLASLPDNYFAVTNFGAPGEERGDIDLILIGPMGILVIEIKMYEGIIVYANGQWGKRRSQNYVQPLKANPSRQARGHERSVRKFLDGYRRRNHANEGLPIEPVVVFVGADSSRSQVWM